MKHAFAIGAEVRFNNTDADKQNDAECGVVARHLTDSERDPEVGPMYEVALRNGATINAFEDELETP